MSQQKFNCPTCRRLVDIHVEFCPYCSTKVEFKPYVPKKQTQKTETTSTAPTGKTNSFTETQIKEDSFQNTHNNPTDIKRIQPKIITDDVFEELPPVTPVINENPKPKVSTEQKKQTVKETEDTNSLSQEKTSDKISWKDEKKEYTPTKNPYENGIYNPNYDGMYDDILPKIENELENLKTGIEKTILKVIFSIIAIIGIVVYLVLTI